MCFSEGFADLLGRSDGSVFDIIDVLSAASAAMNSRFASYELAVFMFVPPVLSLVFCCKFVSNFPTSGLSTIVG